MNNIVNIKSWRADEWIDRNWSIPAKNIAYNRENFCVTVTFDMNRDCSCDIPDVEIQYPILKSKAAPYVALSPFYMVDMYADYGFIAAPGHHDLSICGLKILLKDVGIEVSIKQIQDYKNRTIESLYSRASFGIYPKSDADYGYFSLYFCDDIVKNMSDKFAELHGLKTIKGKTNARN